MTGNLLKEPIELLLEDEHSDVVWGEKIAGIAELRKNIDCPYTTNLGGHITIKFIEEPNRGDIEALLRPGEEVKGGVCGTLTKKGYTPDSLHVSRVTKSSSTSIIDFRKSTASIYVKFENGRYIVDPRAIEIAGAYHHKITADKDWVVRKE